MALHLPEGLKEQWERMRAGLGNRHAIDSLMTLYRAELHELHNAEQQLGALADEIWVSVHNAPLAERLSQYAGALRTRETQLGRMLSTVENESRERPDEVMRALVEKTSRMAEQSSENVRDAAIVAAIQRIIHYMIAEYGTIASHAKALGRLDEAAHFALQADLDQEVDRELSELAKSSLNPEATKTTEKRGH